MIDGESVGYTLVFASLDKGAAISIRNHVRSYQRSRLRGQDLATPKFWLDRSSITFPGWPRDLVLSAVEHSFKRMGTGFRHPRYTLREATAEDLGHFESEPTPPGVSQGAPPLTEVSAPSAEPELPSGEPRQPVRGGDFVLLVAKGVMDTLSEVPDAHKSDALSFLRGLTSGDWLSWDKEQDGVRQWRSPDGSRTLFTRTVEGLGTAIWESAEAIDLMASVLPVGIVEGSSALASRTRPHVILYEFRLALLDGKTPLAFQDVFFGAEAPSAPIPEPRPVTGLELSHLQQFYLLSPARMKDLVEGEEVGLLLYLSEDQLLPFSSPGPILLGGEAGSGKSSAIVLWLVANHVGYLWRNPGAHPLRQLFVTYSPRLRDRARQEFELVLPSKYRGHATEFKTFREMLQEICSVAGSLGKFDPSREVGFEWFVNRFGSVQPHASVDPVLLWDEIRSNIKGGSIDDPLGFLDLSDYQRLSDRRGRAKIPREMRESYYEAAQRYRAILQTEGLWDQLDFVGSCLKVVGEIWGQRAYDRIACDEVQDLAPREIALIISLLRDQNLRSLFLTGDEAQVINPSGFSWARLKGDLGSRVRPLIIPDVITYRRNFRSSKEIVELVNSILRVRKELLDDPVSQQAQEAVRATGVTPLGACSLTLFA